MRFALLVLVILASISPAGLYASNPSDRLENFRDLVRQLLPAEDNDGEIPLQAVQEIQALIDEEILDSLNSGGPFASEAFLQERFSGLAEQWGWGTFQVSRLTSVRSVVVASIQLVPGGEGSSVRLYAREGEQYTLASVIQRDASPLVFELPPSRSGAAHLLLGWVGAPSGHGVVPLTLELIRFDGQSSRTVWETGRFFSEGLQVLDFGVQKQEITIRYPGSYPGRKLGCEGETEQVDRFRYDPERETLVLASRTVINGWHRELYEKAIHPILDALKNGDQRVLSALIPSGQLRQRLSPDLEILPVCEEARPASAPTEILVSAEQPRADRSPTPTTLLFRKSPRGWTLVDVKSEE